MKEDYEKRYHELEENHWWMRGRRAICRALVLQTSPDRNARVLEIGCSAGLFMSQLRGDGYTHVTGIDISPVAVEMCRERGIEDAHVMDAQKLTFEDESFEVLIASDVLEHLEDESRGLREWRRLLRPGGMLFIFVPAFQALWSEHDEANKHFRRYRRADLRQRLQENGFVVLRSSYWNFFLFFPVLMVRTIKRLLPRKPGSAERTDLFPTPPFIAWPLLSLLRLENWFIVRGFNWPFGVSVMAVAQKPAAK